MNRRSRGFALILVIWALVLLTSLATGFALAIRHEIRVAGDLASIAQAEATATAALHATAFMVSLKEPTQRWQADKRLRKLPWPDADIGVRVQSESGKINVNLAPRELFNGLFTQFMSPARAEALTDALLDWRDGDDEPEPSGAEQEDYSRAGYAYGPANASFNSVNELRRVLGFDYPTVELLKPYLTVHSKRPRINVLGADAVALMAIPGVDWTSPCCAAGDGTWKAGPMKDCCRSTSMSDWPTASCVASMPSSDSIAPAAIP
jgi:general secretion pathway protein K